MGKEKKISPAAKSNLHTILNASYTNKKTAKIDLAKKGYTLDHKLSGKRAKVFLDPEGNPSIVYTGTKTIQDVGTDIKFVAGFKKSKRMKHSKKVFKRVKKKYGTNNIDLYGHSLGGLLAENIPTKGNVVTYNKASRGEKVTNKKQTDIRTKYDVVSLLTPKHKNSIRIKGIKNPLKTHSIDMLK